MKTMNHDPTEPLEESLFKMLSHQTRRDIIRAVGEHHGITFSEIQKIVGIADSPSLSYHLAMLTALILQRDGTYSLSEFGVETYNLLRKTTVSTDSTRVVRSFRTLLPLVIVANALFWASALFAVFFFEGHPHLLTLCSFAALWFASNLLLYSLSQRAQRTRE